MRIENEPAEPSGPHGRTFHIHLSVRGAIRDFSKRQLKGMFSVDGRGCTADEARDHLFEALPSAKRFCRSARHVTASISVAADALDTKHHRGEP